MGSYSRTYAERHHTYLQFSMRESVHTRFHNFRHHHHNSSSSSSSVNQHLQAGISYCVDFSTKRLCLLCRCDQSPSDYFSLIPRFCGRSSSISLGAHRTTPFAANSALRGKGVTSAHTPPLFRLRVEPLLRKLLAATYCKRVDLLLT